MGSRYTREELLKNDAAPVTEEQLHRAEMIAKMVVPFQTVPMFAVFRWEEAPETLRKLCCYNGGDEDWMVIVREEPEWLPSWIERTDSCHEPDVYVLNGVVIYVGSHA